MNNLFTTYYPEQMKSRKDELDFCLRVNQSVFDKVVVLSEGVKKPDWFKGRWIFTETRQKYSDVLKLVRRSSKANDLTVIANCDIVIPEPEIINYHLKTHDAFCLTRWDITSRGIKLWEVPYSQDTWCIRGKPDKELECDYYFGVPGCDNRFAYDLYNCGYNVSNPSIDVTTFHLHLSNCRTKTNVRLHRTYGMYLHIHPGHLNEKTKIDVQNRLPVLGR